MGVKIHQEFVFPDEFPKTTTGVFLYDQKILITGHENGYLMKWNLENGKKERLHECCSKIETISVSPSTEILVGCNSGLFFSFPLSSPNEKTILQESEHSKLSRVWRSIWPTEKNILQTSTYGGFYHYIKENSHWTKVPLGGHNDSIFAVGNQNGKLVATGDYHGLIIVWEFNEGKYQSVGRLRINGKVEGISWIKDDTFSTIDELGHINIIEYDPEVNAWKIVFEADAATDTGTSINVTDDKKTIFAGSRNEIIQFDLDSQQLQTIELPKSKRIFSKGNTIYVLTTDGLSSFERHEIDVPVNIVKYRYAKISLMGKTGVGKSTLCNLILKGSHDHLESTFGRKVWTWFPPNDEPDVEKRIIFHDHGGQDAVLGTFLPFLTDSDIVLILFKQTDKETFQKAYQILGELEPTVNNQTKLFFVQTHIDHEMNDVDSKQIDLLKTSNEILDCLKISSTANKGIDILKKRLVDEVLWSNSRTMIQSEHSIGLSKTVRYFEENNATVVDFNSFKKSYKEVTKLDIPIRHLEFLLKSFSSQGFIEYYSELKSIIFQDESFEKLRTNIPILVDQNKGIITIDKIEQEFGKSQYVSILDQVFQNSNLALKYGNLRIFPNYLRKDGIEIKEPFKSFLNSPDSIHKELFFPLQSVERTNFLKALIELKLNCIGVSTNEGMFAWQNNASVYYVISEAGNELKGRKLKVSYYIGGKKSPICQRLHKEFVDILTRIFGTPLQTADSEQ